MLSKLLRPTGRNDTGYRSDNSRGVAKKRLFHALNRDRYDLLSPDVVDSLRRELLPIISRHLDVDSEFHELEIRKVDEFFYLVASVRVSGLPRWGAVG